MATSASAASRQERAALSWRSDAMATLIVAAIAIVMWLPRGAGPIDLRWDGAVYYILGTSLAEGRGYKLLNEPGEIDAVQYPPLLPAIVAGHQLALGTSDPTIVGRWLRLTSFAVFLVYAVVVLRFFRAWLRIEHAVLGTLLSLFCLHAWFLSDALFPEVWFALATVLFVISSRQRESRAHGVLAYFWAVVAYGLRTVGLAAFAVWVLDSLLQRRWRQAIVRALLAAVPVLSWQVYVATVERSPEYNEPAYAYQRAPYMFYNVSYARNIALRDPFTPEKGPVQMERRVVRNALEVPARLGETLTASHRYFEMWLHRLFGSGRIANLVVYWSVFAGLSVIGAVLVLGGTAAQLVAGRRLVPMYILVYIAALCLTPFPAQYMRYLMPIAPLLALAAITLLLRIGSRPSLPWMVLGPALAIQVATTVAVFAWEYRPVDYVDGAGRRVTHRMFFYDSAQREFDEAVTYLQTSAPPDAVVAAGTPHWIYLRTGLKTVMPPLEADAGKAQQLLDTVPADYLVVGADVVGSERYTAPLIRQFADRWIPVHTTATGAWTVYRRSG